MATSIKIGILAFIVFLYSSSIGQVNLTNGLVAQYNFSGNANDVSGNGHDGTALNGISLTTDRFGNPNSAYLFDGIDDYIRVTDNGAFSTPQISLSLWFKTNSNALQNLVGKRKFNDDGTAAGGAQYQFFINYGPFPGIGSNLVGNVGNTCNTVVSSSYVNTGDVICKSKWYHAVVTFDGSVHRIYIDGVLILSSATSFTSMLSCSSELRFGNWWALGMIPFSGIMDDIRWYNRPLNQAEVTALYGNFPTSSSVDFSYSQSPCTPNTVQFTNLTPGVSTIFWDFGNGITNTSSQTPTVNYSGSGNYPVKLRVQTSSGCKDSIVKLMPVFLQQDSLITVADTNICRGNNLQLNAITAFEYCWNPNPALSNTSIRNPVVNPSANGTYILRSKSAGTNLVVNGDFSAGNSGFTSDYIYSDVNTGIGRYKVGTNPNTWSPSFAACTDHTTGTGNMMIVNGASQVGQKIWQSTVAVTANTNYVFSVWVSSIHSANPANLRFSINNNLLPVVISASSSTCNWVQFHATWNSGSMNNVSIAIANNNPGGFGNDFALDDIVFAPVFLKQDSINITVTDPPDITITPNTSICPGESVQLSASGAASYSWSPSTGLSNAAISNPVASPSVTTKYLVTGHNIPGCAGKDSVTITLKTNPVITRIADTGICTGAPPVTLFADAPGAAQYVWTPAAGLSNPNISNPAASPAATTRYFVEITGINGCKSRDSVNVAVLPVPVVNTRPDTTICEASNLELRTTSSGATSFSWSPTTGLSDPTMANPVATPLVPTRYVVTASNGSCTAKDSVMLNLIAAPVVTKSGDTTICHQGQAQLFASGGVGYSWMPATGLSSTSVPNPVASPPAPTRYYVTVTGSNGCSRRDSINIGWVAKPVFTVNPSATSSCIGDTVLLTAAGADNYHWYSGTNILSRYTAATMVVPGASQQYSVAVQHVFCRLRDTLRAAITVNSLPYVELAKSNDIDCSNASATLTATGGVSYSWYPASAVPGGNGPTAVVTPATSTTYRVVATDANGCRGSDSVRVVVNMDPSTAGYYMANAFTPNNDGKNDCFGIKYWGVVEQLEFSVYNRWGERIFHSRNVSSCWDGSYRGVPQPAGTYVFQVKAVTACGEVFKRGSLVLMR